MEKLKKSIGKHCNLYFNEPIDKWDEAIPLGNGHSGCLLWGDGKTIRLSLDRGELWDKRGAPGISSEDFTYSKLIELVSNGDYKSIDKIFEDIYYNITPTKIPAGKILLNFNSASQKFTGTLDIQKAMAEVRLSFDGKRADINTFVHATRHAGFIRIFSESIFPEIELTAPGFGVIDKGNDKNSVPMGKNISNGSLGQLLYPPVIWGKHEEMMWFVQKTAEELEYGIILGQRTIGTTMEIVYTVAANEEGDADWLKHSMDLVKKALDDGYDFCLREHQKWWRNFWAKSAVCLPDKEFEKQWYLTNYLFGS